MLRRRYHYHPGLIFSGARSSFTRTPLGLCGSASNGHSNGSKITPHTVLDEVPGRSSPSYSSLGLRVATRQPLVDLCTMSRNGAKQSHSGKHRPGGESSDESVGVSLNPFSRLSESSNSSSCGTSATDGLTVSGDKRLRTMRQYIRSIVVEAMVLQYSQSVEQEAAPENCQDVKHHDSTNATSPTNFPKSSSSSSSPMAPDRFEKHEEVPVDKLISERKSAAEEDKPADGDGALLGPLSFRQECLSFVIQRLEFDTMALLKGGEGASEILGLFRDMDHHSPVCLLDVIGNFSKRLIPDQRPVGFFPKWFEARGSLLDDHKTRMEDGAKNPITDLKDLENMAINAENIAKDDEKRREDILLAVSAIFDNYVDEQLEELFEQPEVVACLDHECSGWTIDQVRTEWKRLGKPHCAELMVLTIREELMAELDKLFQKNAKKVLSANNDKEPSR